MLRLLEILLPIHILNYYEIACKMYKTIIRMSICTLFSNLDGLSICRTSLQPQNAFYFNSVKSSNSIICILKSKMCICITINRMELKVSHSLALHYSREIDPHLSHLKHCCSHSCLMPFSFTTIPSSDTFAWREHSMLMAPNRNRIYRTHY